MGEPGASSRRDWQRSEPANQNSMKVAVDRSAHTEEAPGRWAPRRCAAGDAVEHQRRYVLLVRDMGQTTQVRSATGPLAPSEASSTITRYLRGTEIVDPIANPKKKRRKIDLNALSACLSKPDVCLEAYCFQARPLTCNLG